MPLFYLDDTLSFPNCQQALTEPAGLLAIGGDLRPERMLLAYQSGIFPWCNSTDPLLWWAPDPRTIFLPESMHFSRRLLRTLKQNPFQLSLNRSFSQVVSACAASRSGQAGTWILPALEQCYLQLHQTGWAHSLEVWQQGQLQGGVFGVNIGRAFFAESMFSLCSNASKAGLLALRRHLLRQGCLLIDTQFKTPHLSSLGAIELARTDYMNLLKQAITQPAQGAWPSPEKGSVMLDSQAFVTDSEGEQPWDF